MKRKIGIWAILMVLAFAGTPAFSDTGREDLALNISSENPVRFNFYPNPTPRNLSIDLAFDKVGPFEIEIHLRNLIGKEMMEVVKVQSSGSSHHLDLDLADLPAGIYLLEVSTLHNGNNAKMIRRITKS